MCIFFKSFISINRPALIYWLHIGAWFLLVFSFFFFLWNLLIIEFIHSKAADEHWVYNKRRFSKPAVSFSAELPGVFFLSFVHLLLSIMSVNTAQRHPCCHRISSLLFHLLRTRFNLSTMSSCLTAALFNRCTRCESTPQTTGYFLPSFKHLKFILPLQRS